MRKYYKLTPEGTRDLLFEDSAAINTVSGILSDIFREKGYHQVITPTLEFYDTFTLEGFGYLSEEMFISTDKKGRLLALRPDSTIPIARIVATRLKDEALPLKLCYNQPIYRNNKSLSGRTDEIRQAGMELIGASGKRADIELIVSAVEILKRVTPFFRLELGHAIFLKSILNRLDVEEYKNRGTEAESALFYLKDLYRDLSAILPEDKLMIDLGMVQKSDYYSDMIFCGYVEGSGDAVLNGGRYDKLLSQFRKSVSAAGFGVNVDELARIYMSINGEEKPEAADIIVHGDDGYEIEAIKKKQELVSQGFRCEYSVFSSSDSARFYARKKGIKKICIVNANSRIEEI